MGMKKEISMEISLRFTVIMHPFSPFSPSSVAILSTFRYLKSRNKQLCSTAISLICEWLTACAIVLSLFLSFDFAQIFFVVCPHRSGTNLFNGFKCGVITIQWCFSLGAHDLSLCVCVCAVHSLFTRCIFCIVRTTNALFFARRRREGGRKDAELYVCSYCTHAFCLARSLFSQ